MDAAKVAEILKVVKQNESGCLLEWTCVRKYWQPRLEYRIMKEGKGVRNVEL